MLYKSPTDYFSSKVWIRIKLYIDCNENKRFYKKYIDNRIYNK